MSKFTIFASERTGSTSLAKVLRVNPLHLLFGAVVLLSAYIRFSQSLDFDFPFTYDQARDMLDIRVLGSFLDYRISGPTTSITGLNLGPFYYVFNLPAYWLGGGNPQFLVYWNILWFLFSGILLYAFFYKRNKKTLAFIAASIYLMSPQLFSVTRYFWNANAVVYFIVFYFLAFWKFVENKNKLNALIWGITAGLVIQFEAAFGSMCVAFSFLVIISTKNKLNARNYLIGLVPWFIPQIAYEFINDFQMTKLLRGVINGENTLLGEKLPILEVLKLHLSSFTNFFEGQFMLFYGGGLIVLVISLVIALKSKEYARHAKYLAAFILFAYVYFSILYPRALKPWYLEGLRVWFVIIVSIALTVASKINKLALTLVALFLIRSFYLTAFDQSIYISDNGKSDDPKNAQNIMRSIDWVYEKASGEGFAAYNYVPEIHDFSANYLYWWYGKNQYGYIPERITYSLDPVPEYVRMENKFKKDARGENSESIALMYEKIGDYDTWLTQFDDYCTAEKIDFNWRVTVEWRNKC